jgi:ATP-dependent Clp protease protease subunit
MLIIRKEQMSDNENVEEESTEEEDMSSLMAAMMGAAKEPRVVGIFGDIDEERSSMVCASLITFLKSSMEPIEVFVSTNGGSADEMYAIVDTMKYLQSLDVEIHNIGIGKIMSAGVMILAAGSKGYRKAGKNTRFMLHALQSGTQGPFPHMKIDMKNFNDMQEKYVRVLSELTNLSYKELKKIVNKRVDTYFTAEEALKMGIIDEIL